MAKSKKTSGMNIAALLGTALIVIMLIMCFLPFFTFKSTLLGNETTKTSSGFNSIFGIFKEEYSNDNSEGLNMAISMYKNDDTKGSMAVLGIAGLASLAAAVLLLALNLLDLSGKKFKLAKIMKIVGIILVTAAITTIIMGFVVAGNAKSFSGFIVSAETTASIGMWLFAGTGILAGLIPLTKK